MSTEGTQKTQKTQKDVDTLLAEALQKLKEAFDNTSEVKSSNYGLYEEPVKPVDDLLREDFFQSTGNTLKKSIKVQWPDTTQLWVLSFHKLIPIAIIEYGLSYMNNDFQYDVSKAKAFLATKNVEDSDFIMQKLDEVQVQYLGRFNF